MPNFTAIAVRSRVPLVSVCIPTFNRARLLRESLESVLAQSFEDFELIVSDNASADETEQVVRSYRDPRLRYIRHKKNVGIVGNFNGCLQEARGAYINIFHDDDVMLRDNLLLKVKALNENPTAGLVHSKFHTIDERGNLLQTDTNFGPLQTTDRLERGHDFLRRSLLGFNPVNPPSAMIRQECYSRLGGLNACVAFTNDYEYWMRIAIHYDVIFLATPLLKYRIHSGWGTAKYTTVINGRVLSNFRGLQQEYTAKRLVLDRCNQEVKNWGALRASVRAAVRDQMMYLLEVGPGDREQARSMVAMFWEFPELLRRKAALKMLLKIALGERLTSRIKGLVRHAHR